MEGHTVIIGFDGQMALQQVKAAHPQLVVLDVNMPMLNGLKALDYMRQIPEGKLIPIIFLTGYSSRLYRMYAPFIGGSAFLMKPIDNEKLLKHVRALMPEEQPEHA